MMNAQMPDVECMKSVSSFIIRRSSFIIHRSSSLHGGHWSFMKGAAGGPSTVRMPGGVGMTSPIRTSERPPTFTPLLARGPIGSGYGKPHTELIIMHSEPEVASGIPPARMTGGKMPTIVPVSGGPEAPGVIITMQPIVTGGPGIGFLLTVKTKSFL
jgi:hypothetical protein